MSWRVAVRVEHNPGTIYIIIRGKLTLCAALSGSLSFKQTSIASSLGIFSVIHHRISISLSQRLLLLRFCFLLFSPSNGSWDGSWWIGSHELSWYWFSYWSGSVTFLACCGIPHVIGLYSDCVRKRDSGTVLHKRRVVHFVYSVCRRDLGIVLHKRRVVKCVLVCDGLWLSWDGCVCLVGHWNLITS